MELLQKIDADLKQAQLARDESATSTLRLLKSELANARIAAGNDLPEAAILQVIKREVKKRTEAADAYRTAQSPDRAAQEEQEATLLSGYLPPQATPADIEAYLASQGSDLDPSKRGELIRSTIEHFGGQADGKLVADAVAKLLS